MLEYKDFMLQHMDMDEVAWQNFYGSLIKKEFKRNQIIFDIGDVHKEMCYIESGIVRSFYLDENGKDTTWIIHFNDKNASALNLFVSDYDSFNMQTPSRLAFEVLEDAVLYMRAKETISFYRHTDINWTLFALKMSNGAYSLIHNRYLDMLTKSAKERYEQFMQETPFLLEKVPQYHIASYLGMTYQHFSRLKKHNKCE